MPKSDVTTTSVRRLSRTHDHGKYSIAPPSQYMLPRASVHGVINKGIQLDARIASKIRIPDVFPVENTVSVPSVRLVAVMVSEYPGRFAVRSANVLLARDQDARLCNVLSLNHARHALLLYVHHAPNRI